MHKFFIIILTLFTISCVNEVTLEPSTYFEIENVQIEVDKFENELYLQAEVEYWNGNENITSVQAELSIYQSGSYQSIGSFNLVDGGQDGDIISENGIYSRLANAENILIIEVEPDIKSINVASHYQLAQSDSDSLLIELIVSGKSLRVIFTAEDIDGVIAQYIEYTNLSNSYIEIQFNDFGMLKDPNVRTQNDDGICLREEIVIDDGYTWLNNIDKKRNNFQSIVQIGNSNNFQYSHNIPMNSLDECGATGAVKLKFILHDLDFYDCMSGYSENCLSNVISEESKEIIVFGCGDNNCTPVYESSASCSEDCE